MTSKILPDSWAIFILQILAHVGLLYQVFYGYWYQWFFTLTIYFFTGCFGMTMTYHRLLSHKSWRAPRWFEIFGTLCATYGLTGSSIAWVAIHREHHHHTDDKEDPHSPHHKGFINVQWFSMFEKPNPRYSAHLLRDQLHVLIHKWYVLIHICILSLLLYISPGVAISCYLAPAALLWNFGSAINTLTHMIGYRNYNTKDNSTNIWWLGYLMWGEGWHNNHHNQPNNPSFKKKWWELDVGHALICLIRQR
jgi:stearoyl-CoA desaturase (delta-9 desaturase)